MYKANEQVSSMSMRQQILYIMQMSSNTQTEWDNDDDIAYINPNERYEQMKFKQRDQDLLMHPERWRMLAHAMTQFTPIKKNRFLERNKQLLQPKDYQQFSCACQPRQRALQSQLGRSRQRGSHRAFNEEEQSFDCGEQCLNRSVAQDCALEVCPVGDSCRNRRFQLHQNAYAYPVKTEKKGWGLAAGEPLAQGSFIMQYVGEVFNEDSVIGQKRIEKYKLSSCTYMMRTEFGEIIDPTSYGNIARFINHSCDPNCVVRKWTVGKETSIGIFARKNIQEDEEMTFDYQFDTFKTPFTKCYCGTTKCKGYLGLAVYDKIDDDVNAPVCQICFEDVETKEQLVVCKGTCDKVFHLNCVKTITYKVDRNNYFCKPCAKLNRKILKKEKEAFNNDNEDMMSQYSGNSAGNKKTPYNDDSFHDKDSINESQTKTPKKSKVAKSKPIIAYMPIKEDPEAMGYKQDNPENELLDKVLHREIYLIDQTQQSPFLQINLEELLPKEKGLVKSGLEDLNDIDENMLQPKPRSKKRKIGVFSSYYNFYFELCKRLKVRMKENRKNFKFRKIYQRSKSAAPKKSGKSTTKKIYRKKPAKSASKSTVKTKRKYTKRSVKKLQDQPAPVVVVTSEFNPNVAKVDIEETKAATQNPLQIKRSASTPFMQNKIKSEKSKFLEEQEEVPPESMEYDAKVEDESQSLNFDTDYGGEIEEVNSEEMHILNNAAPVYDKQGVLIPISNLKKKAVQPDDVNIDLVGEDIELQIDQLSSQDMEYKQGGSKAIQQTQDVVAMVDQTPLGGQNQESPLKLTKALSMPLIENRVEAIIPVVDIEIKTDDEMIESECDPIKVKADVQNNVIEEEDEDMQEESEESMEEGEEEFEEEIEEEMTESVLSDEEAVESYEEDNDDESDKDSEGACIEDTVTQSEVSSSDEDIKKSVPIRKEVDDDNMSSSSEEEEAVSRSDQSSSAAADTPSQREPKNRRAVKEFLDAFNADQQEQQQRQCAVEQVDEVSSKDDNDQVQEERPKRKYQRRLVKESEKQEKTFEEEMKLPPRKRGRPSKVELAERLRLQENHMKLLKKKEEENTPPKERIRSLKKNSDFAFRGLAGNNSIENERAIKQSKRRLSTNSLSKTKKREKRVNIEQKIAATKTNLKEKLDNKVRIMVEEFVDKEIELEDSHEQQTIECRTSRLNLYEDLFNLVFIRNMDLLEAISNIYMHWDNPWGSLVTLKLTCNQQQFSQILGILQYTINKMTKLQLIQAPLGQQIYQRLKEVNGKTNPTVMPFLIMTLKVPKVFLKKLIGYQEKVLLHLKRSHEVNFVYDDKLVNDLVYALDDTSIFRIFGKGRDVAKVSTFLQIELDKLAIRTLSVTKEESKFILDNIKECKAQIDPCEIRVKRVLKEKGDIKHPFFYSPNLSRDVCLIGTEAEVERAEQRLYEFYTYRNDSPELTRTSLCCLLPALLREDIQDIKKHLYRKSPDVVATHYLPQRPRRHITIYMTGSWKNLIEAKNAIAQITNEKIKRLKLDYTSFDGFQEFTFCQQLRFNFKILKRIVLEDALVFLKFWDTTSVELKEIAETPRDDEQPLEQAPLPPQQQRLDKEIAREYQALTPFLKEGFPELEGQMISETQVQEMGYRYLRQYKNDSKQKLLNYMKVYDQETALNALFVLSEENQNLPQICQRLTIDKALFVHMAFLTLQDILKKQFFPAIKDYRETDTLQRAQLEVRKYHDRIECMRQQTLDQTRDRGREIGHKIIGKQTEQEAIRRNRRSRSRSNSRFQTQDKPSESLLKLKRYSSSRQEYLEDPQLIDHKSIREKSERGRGDHDRESSRYNRDRDRDHSQHHYSESRGGEREYDRDRDYEKSRDRDRERDRLISTDRPGRIDRERGDWDRSQQSGRYAASSTSLKRSSSNMQGLEHDIQHLSRREQKQQRQKEFERERERERRMLQSQEDKQRDRQREIEREQREIERQRELDRLAELEREHELKKKKQREQEREIVKQRELEIKKQREHDKEAERQCKEREQERKLQLEKEKQLKEQRDLVRKAELDMELDIEKENELKRLRQNEREKELEELRERERVRQVDHQQELDRFKKERMRGMERMQLQRERELDRQKDLQVQREQERIRNLERQRQIELESEKDLQRQAEIDLKNELARQASKEKQVFIEKQLEKQKELERVLLKKEEDERQRMKQEQKESKLEEERVMDLGEVVKEQDSLKAQSETIKQQIQNIKVNAELSDIFKSQSYSNSSGSVDSEVDLGSDQKHKVKVSKDVKPAQSKQSNPEHFKILAEQPPSQSDDKPVKWKITEEDKNIMDGSKKTQHPVISQTKKVAQFTENKVTDPNFCQKNQLKLMKIYNAELAGIEQKYGFKQKPDLIKAQQMRHHLKMGQPRRSRSRSKSPPPAQIKPTHDQPSAVTPKATSNTKKPYLKLNFDGSKQAHHKAFLHADSYRQRKNIQKVDALIDKMYPHVSSDSKMDPHFVNIKHQSKEYINYLSNTEKYKDYQPSYRNKSSKADYDHQQGPHPSSSYGNAPYLKYHYEKMEPMYAKSRTTSNFHDHPLPIQRDGSQTYQRNRDSKNQQQSQPMDYDMIEGDTRAFLKKTNSKVIEGDTRAFLKKINSKDITKITNFDEYREKAAQRSKNQIDEKVFDDPSNNNKELQPLKQPIYHESSSTNKHQPQQTHSTSQSHMKLQKSVSQQYGHHHHENSHHQMNSSNKYETHQRRVTNQRQTSSKYTTNQRMDHHYSSRAAMPRHQYSGYPEDNDYVDSLPHSRRDSSRSPSQRRQSREPQQFAAPESRRQPSPQPQPQCEGSSGGSRHHRGAEYPSYPDQSQRRAIAKEKSDQDVHQQSKKQQQDQDYASPSEGVDRPQKSGIRQGGGDEEMGQDFRSQVYQDIKRQQSQPDGGKYPIYAKATFSRRQRP